MKKLILLFVTVLAISAAATLTHSEKYPINGTVSDSSGEPLIGASLIIKGTTEGAVTDFDGKFSFLASDSCVTLVIYYTGFSTLESVVCSGKENKLVLEDGATLDEVVVTSIGFASEKKSKGSKAAGKSKKRMRADAKPAEMSKPASKSLPSPPAGSVITADEMRKLSTRDISGVSAKTAGLSSSSGAEVKIRGARTDAATYYVDGVRVSGSLIKESSVTTGATISGTPSTLDSPVKKDLSGEVAKFDDTERIEIVEREEIAVDTDLATEPVEKPLSAGQLTAGEWSDLQNWEDWKSTAAEDLLAMETIWDINPGQRYSVLVKNESGKPVPNAIAQLKDSKGNILWQSRTNNIGRAELWHKAGKDKASSKVDPEVISVDYEGVSQKINKITAFEKGINELILAVDCPEFEKTEILFVVDATGSMGDEIRYLQAELGDVINRVKSLDFIDKLHTGSVFYRDIGDEYVLRKQNLSADTDATMKFIAQQSANGGGDGPEAVETALEEAIINQPWSEDAGARIAFIILDAPPHQTEEIKAKMKNLAKKAAEKGIRIVPILASGSQSSCEYLMRSIAMTTNSRFLFLTDDSGIGNPHAEPSVGAYDVVFLNDLIFKLIVEFTAYDKCDEQQQVAVNQAIGTEETFKASCYPLPANSFVFVDLENDVDKLEVVDLQGQLLLTKSMLPQGISTIYIDNLPPGTYIFKFIRDKEFQSVKVIKSGV